MTDKERPESNPSPDEGAGVAGEATADVEQAQPDPAAKKTKSQKTAARRRKKAATSTGAGPKAAKQEAAKAKRPKANGPGPDGREELLQVDSYEKAVVLLTQKPDLIEQARLIFGRVVPTTGQTDVVDLAIKAAAEDDDLTLRQALATKRAGHLALTHPEITQLLEFGHTALTKAPILSLNLALLVTDDLTRLENKDLWQQQKRVILAAEKTLKLDATDLWDQINEPATAPATAAPAPEAKSPRTTGRSWPSPEAGPGPVTSLRPKKRVKPVGYEMPRWALFTIFFTLMIVMSCCLCALGAFAGY